MSNLLEALAQRALDQRLEPDGGDWSQQMSAPPAQWLRWAMLRDAATLLSTLRIPAFVTFAQRMRAQPGVITDIHFDASQFYFLKLAMVVASHRLVRMPEYGPVWNGIQAQRLEIRQVADALERAGRGEDAQAWRRRMPPVLRREDARKGRREREEATAVLPGPAHPNATPPVPVPEQRTGGIRP